MTDLISAVMGLSFAAGLNAYATFAALGVMQRLGWIDLPAGLEAVGSTPVIAVASILYVVEFIADKIPLFDSLWDAIHTVIRPAAGAILAYGFAGSADPGWQVAATLAGGGIALASHSAKASTRAAVNVSPEPFSNWALSLAEDGIAFFLVWITFEHPWIALTAAAAMLVLAAGIIWKLSRMVRRLFRRAA